MKEIKLYDIGDLKNDPWKLYNLATRFHDFFPMRGDDQTAEIWLVLERVAHSLWDNLPPVVTIDFRDPDDPSTWGDFGAPPSSDRL